MEVVFVTAPQHRPAVVVAEEEDVDVTPTTRTTPAARQLEQIPTGVVTLEEAAAAVRKEAKAKGINCTLRQAKKSVRWLGNIVNKARRSPGKIYFPTTQEMSGMSYRLINAIMPHDGHSTPGSAHALTEQYLLDASADEFAILHDQRERPSFPGEQIWCSYQVCVGVVPLNEVPSLN